jgi:hypothetical protein
MRSSLGRVTLASVERLLGTPLPELCSDRHSDPDVSGVLPRSAGPGE